MRSTDAGAQSPTLIVTTRAGEVKSVPAKVGRSVMESIRDANISEIQALCGGCGACCTCHVFVDPQRLDALSPMSEQENALLDSSDARAPNSRLACQVPVTEALDGLKLTIAPEV
jgi:ferredoxin, 2Fe-2S